MKETTWKIIKINEDTGEVFVEFKCDNNSTKNLYKWNNNKELLLENIRNDAIAYSKNFLEFPVENNVKEELINLNSTNANGSPTQ